MEGRGSADLPILDLAFLAEQTFGDAALARHVLLLFEEQCEALGPVIADSTGPSQRATALHTLKGAARAIGAARLADRLERFEAALARGAQPGDLSPADVLEAIAAARKAGADYRGEEA